MKRTITFLISLLLLAGVNAQQINDPNAQVREAKDFHGIDVSNAFTVYITQGNTEAVAVSATDTKDLSKIKVVVKNGILHIGMENNANLNFGKKKDFKAYISFKQIDQLEISGACNVFINGVLKANELSIDQSGASDLKGKIEVDKLAVDLSGASDVTLSGTARQLHVEASGASDFRGFDLVTEICNVDASGASDIKITVNKELSAEASGASDVRYKGNGVIKELRNSGSSSISKS
jgi:hypothetical protein